MALLIRTDGTVTEVSPLNGAHFQFVGEAYELLGTDMIQIVPTKDGRIMLVDEEGKLKDKPINFRATALYEHGKYDVVVGTVLVCADTEVR